MEFFQSAQWLQWVLSPQWRSPGRESLLPLPSPAASPLVQWLLSSVMLPLLCPSHNCLRRAWPPHWCWVVVRDSFCAALLALLFGLLSFFVAILWVVLLRWWGRWGIFWVFGFRCWVVGWAVWDFALRVWAFGLNWHWISIILNVSQSNWLQSICFKADYYL